MNTSTYVTDLRISEYRLSKYKLLRSESGLQHLPYSFEKKAMMEVANGNPQYFESLRSSYTDFELGEMAKSDLKSAEYGAAIAISLIARECISAGLNPYDAYDLNDLYLQKVSVLNSIDDYLQAIVDAAYDFSALMVKSRQDNSGSMRVENAKQFIIRHISQSFTLADVADYVGLAPNYLSNLFSDKTGITLNEFTIEQRLNAAKNMLRFSDFSIAEISSYFCFCSQSYFSTVFKEREGCTPLQYRKKVSGSQDSKSKKEL